MGLLQIIAFLGSAVGQFLIFAVLIGMVIPTEWLDVFGLIVASILVLLVIGSIFSIVFMFK